MAHNAASLLVPGPNTHESFALDFPPKPYPATGLGFSRFPSVRVGVQPLALHEPQRPTGAPETGRWAHLRITVLQMCVAA